ncbi:MAG: heavy-metal-associated domain-containing protein [Rubrivivax sp.]|nr:heavy-metal-associated domain-containing protein [Rubrivivax sp.]
MIEWTIPTMTCGHCVGVVTRTVRAADPNAEVQIDLASHTVRVDTGEDPALIAKALAAAGYTPQARP